MENPKFLRTKLLLGKDALERIGKARVALFGLGAVGSYALEALVRSGITHFKLIDFDTIKESNFNRQLLATELNLGKLKVEAARERALSINSLCQVEVCPFFSGPENLDILLDSPFDILVDAIDSVGPKVELLARAFERKLKIISCMGAARKMDPLLIRCGDISETKVCRLSMFVRRKLKKKGITKGIRCVYSTEPPIDSVALNTEEDFYERGRSRKSLGSISTITGIFGLMAGHEAIRMILKGNENDGLEA